MAKSSPPPAEPTKPDNSVKTTLITVIGSIVVALLTTVGTIATNSGGIKANTDLDASHANDTMLTTVTVRRIG